jgi:hypothetical protein
MNQKQQRRSDLFIKWLLVFTALYFLGHMINAMADDTLIIPQPDGTQKICIIDRGYVVVCI